MEAGEAGPRGDGGAGDATIVAVATPPGRGAIAVVRLSGPAAPGIAAALGAGALAPRRMTRVALRDAAGAPLDDALVTHFPAPRSVTGEEVVEVSCHGGPAVVAAVVAACVAAGARPAAPGEFTRRAVLHGKLDLLDAEAIAELVAAATDAHRRAALAQRGGVLAARVAAVREACLALEALLAYDLDFPLEDDGPVSRARVLAAADAAQAALAALTDTLPAARVATDGAIVVLAGPPNAGKSALFNALVGQHRAIVTEVPGTTRDALEQVVEGDPWPLRLVDTAGLRATDDRVERLGVARTWEWVAQADVVLACAADDAALAPLVEALAAATAGAVLAVRTQADVTPSGAPLATSAVTGAGLAALRAAVQDALVARVGPAARDVPLVTRARHQAALTTARDELAAFRAAWAAGTLPAPVAATHVRAAVHALDELIGAVDVDEVLARVFATFCVGK